MFTTNEENKEKFLFSLVDFVIRRLFGLATASKSSRKLKPPVIAYNQNSPPKKIVSKSPPRQKKPVSSSKESSPNLKPHRYVIDRSSESSLVRQLTSVIDQNKQTNMSSAPPSYTLNPSVVVSDDEPASKVPRTDPINIQGASGPSSLLSVPVTPRPRSITPVRLSSSVERPRSIARMNDQGRQEFIVRKKKLVASATTAIRKKIDKFDQIKDTAEDRNITEMYGELNELYADILNFYGTYTRTLVSTRMLLIRPIRRHSMNTSKS